MIGLGSRLVEFGLIADGDIHVPKGDESLVPKWNWLAENTSGQAGLSV